MKRLKKYFEKIRLKPRPFIAFQIEPTSRCQLKCVMCPRTALSDEWETGVEDLSPICLFTYHG